MTPTERGRGWIGGTDKIHHLISFRVSTVDSNVGVAGSPRIIGGSVAGESPGGSGVACAHRARRSARVCRAVRSPGVHAILRDSSGSRGSAASASQRYSAFMGPSAPPRRSFFSVFSTCSLFALAVVWALHFAAPRAHTPKIFARALVEVAAANPHSHVRALHVLAGVHLHGPPLASQI